MDFFNKDYYGVLGVLPSAEVFLIKVAYKALSQRYHPDKSKASKQQAEAKMKTLNEAYAILSESSKRKQYDDYLKVQGKQNEYHKEEPVEPDTDESFNNEDWLMAIQYVSELKTLHDDLETISANLGFTFKLYVLRDKAFDNPQSIASELESKFFATFFGNEAKTHEFAKFLLIKGHRSAAQELNKAVKLFDNKIEPEKLAESICSKYKINYIASTNDLYKDPSLQGDKLGLFRTGFWFLLLSFIAVILSQIK
ncbi:MAG: DnaJ domain-containing protein [Methylococcaceae bacterium]|nr:DnaJ domain-containing protein [Methylococcaceae bacterium]